MALSPSSRRFLVFLVLGGGLVYGGLQYFGDVFDTGCEEPDNAGEAVAFTIPDGASAGQVGALLAEQGIICDGADFRRAARDAGVDQKLRAGDYELTVGMQPLAAAEALSVPVAGAPTFSITVAEGLTVAQTLERLAAGTPHTVADYRQVLDARVAAGTNADGQLRIPDYIPSPEEFGDGVREPYEGLLFPLTYEFVETATPLDVLQRMVDQLDAEVAEVPAATVSEFEAVGFRLYDALVIASLVEREARVGDERETIAAVVRNRLDDGQLLQIDASVLYGQGDPEAGAEAVNPDVSSAYNTYENAGLPPTPIAGFRGSLIEAAMEPADVDFRYYVVSPDCDGSHNFAVTLDEHNNNVAAYRNAGRCQE